MKGVFRRGQIWYISYYCNGSRRKERVGENRKSAESALCKRKVEMAEGRFLDVRKREKIKFEDFATTYIELYARPNKRPMVARRDEFLIKRLGTHFNGKNLYEITPQSIERYKAERIKEVAPATVNRELACLKCMFNKAITWGKTDENPVRSVKLFKENNARLRYLEKEEIKIVAVFDIDSTKFNYADNQMTKQKEKTPVLPLEDLPEFVRKNNIKIGIITVPDIAAQQVVDIMLSAGIKGVLNFAPIRLRGNDDCVINNVNLEVELENLIYFVNASTKAKGKIDANKKS